MSDSQSQIGPLHRARINLSINENRLAAWEEKVYRERLTRQERIRELAHTVALLEQEEKELEERLASYTVELGCSLGNPTRIN